MVTKMETEKMEKGIPLLGDIYLKTEVQTMHGKMKLPDNFSSKWFALFSHPADFTPVCITEFYSFAKRYDEFKKFNYSPLVTHLSLPSKDDRLL